MPEPTSKYSTDYYLYKNIYNPISKKICFIHPNIVTLTSLFLVKPLIDNIVLKKSMKGFLTIGFLKYIIDCFDGSIARKCNKKSYFGSILDYTIDSLFYNIVYYFFYKKCLNIISNNSLKIVIHVIYLYWIKSNIKLFYYIITKKGNDSSDLGLKIGNFYQDNMFVLDLIKHYFIKKILLM